MHFWKQTPFIFGLLAVCGTIKAAPDVKPAPSEKKETPDTPKPRSIITVSAQIGEKPEEVLAIELDVNDAPETKEWALAAANYAIKWYPKLAEALASDGFEPTRRVRLEFKEMKGVAHTVGTTITIAAGWIKAHPEDQGMVAHELVHVVQQYRRNDPGWLVEGIADYVRYYVVEPGSERAAFDVKRSDYKSGYQPSAGLLNWIEGKKPGAVKKLNALLREGKYTDAAFKEVAGGDADDLWMQFQKEHAKEQ